MAAIKETTAYKVANKIAKVSPNIGNSAISSASTQVGKAEILLQRLRGKVTQATLDLSNLQEAQPNPLLYTPQQTRKLLFIDRTLKSLSKQADQLNKRLTSLKKTPERLVRSAVLLLGAATILKSAPIPGISLTAGATSTFSGTLEDVRGKGRTLLNNAQAIDSIVDTSAIESFQQELQELQQRVDPLVKAIEPTRT